MALVFNVSLPLSAYISVCRDAYLLLCYYMDISLRALGASRVGASIPAYCTGLYTPLSFSAYNSDSRDAYLPLFYYMDVFLRALNASRVDDSIPAYGTGFRRPCLHKAVSV
jgi:hypothetical protein